MMNAIRRHIDFQTSYSNKLWTWLKIPFIIFWVIIFSTSLFRLSEILTPQGICKFVDCSVFLPQTIKIILFIIAFIASFFYVFEKKMISTLAVLSCASVLVFTMEDSQGIYDRHDVLSGVLIAQLLAYIFFSRKKDILFKRRIQYSQQVIVALYFLSGLAKIMDAGLYWFMNPNGFVLQTYKANLNKYVDLKNDAYLQKANIIIDFTTSYPTLISFLLFLALLFELGSIVFIFLKSKWLIVYGLLMICMHIGIWLTMSIYIAPIIAVNLIFLVGIFHLFRSPFIKKA